MKYLKKIFVLVISVLLIAGCGKDKLPGNNKREEDKEAKKLQIVDESKDTRSYAVMINNNHQAWPHAGLQESYLNYEIITEGGITRFLALFRDSIPEKIGSIRSSRIYFLDYAMENDAIYVHWGGSKEAYSDINSLKLDHIDGMDYEGKYFFRDKTLNRAYEHTGFTKGSMLKEAATALGFKTTSDKGLLLNYSVDEVDLSKMDGALKADDIEIEYSNYQTTNYKYDSENKVYLRSMSGEAHTDLVTGKQYTAKNIITYQVKNSSYDSYGRQELDNIGSGEGYYISNGYAVPFTWEKTCRSCKTIYKYMNGQEIKLNDGNTWIQIQPLNKVLDITGNKENSNNNSSEE